MKRLHNTMEKRKVIPTVADLFCGIGGFSKGFEKAGFEIIFGLDNWKIALETFKNNHKKAEVIDGDIANIQEFHKDF